MGIAAALGIIAGSRTVAAEAVIAYFGLVAGFAILGALMQGYPRAIAVAALAGCIIGGVTSALAAPGDPPPYQGSRRIVTTAVVVSDPEQSRSGLRAFIRWADPDGHMRTSLMFASATTPFHRGDSVAIRGRADGAHADLVYASNLRVASHAGAVEELRARARRWLDETVRGSVGGSEGALALGLLVGDDSALTSDQERQVRDAGLSHITAVSGWNVTLVVTAVGTLLIALGLRGPFWVIAEAVALGAYVWLVGADAPVVRAAIMGALVIAARQLGRPAHGPTLIALATATMIAVDPSATSSLAFQLSILATAALIVAMRVTATWSGWRAILLLPLIATVAIGIATAPALTAATGQLSLVSIPANVTVGPLIPLAAAASILVVATVWHPILHTAASALAWSFTHLILWCAKTFSSVPGAVLDLPRPGDLSLRLSVVALIVIAAFLLPEGRLAVWQIDRWIRRDELAAAIASGGFALGTLVAVAIIVLSG